MHASAITRERTRRLLEGEPDFQVLAEGRRNREIAGQLGMSERTVEFHVGNLLSKLGAASRTQMVHLSRERGWLV
jgi:DNA-binding NarL/FixJ family response regulator